MKTGTYHSCQPRMEVSVPVPRVPFVAEQDEGVEHPSQYRPGLRGAACLREDVIRGHNREDLQRARAVERKEHDGGKRDQEGDKV